MAAAPFERTEIDGVPTYVAEEVGGLCSASLMFRVGRADETMVDGGMCHLIEHLALFGLGERTPYSYNGRVTGLNTEFGMSGTAEEVVEFLAAVTGALSQLPLGRLTDETRVLRTEASASSTGIVEDHLWLRFGATGHGLRRMTELTHLAPDPEKVSAWAAQRFTSGNAALVLGGAVPGIRLTLPSGPRQAPPTLRMIPDVAYPAWFRGSNGLVTLSCSGPRREWLSIGFEIAAARLRKDLRYQRGLSYDVRAIYEPIGKDLGHSILIASSLPENYENVRESLVQVLRHLASNGATPEELERERESHRRQLYNPDAGLYTAGFTAFNELLGRPGESREHMMSELEVMTGADVGGRMKAALETALLIQPPECPEPNGFNSYPLWSEQAVEGETFRHATVRFPWSKGPRLTVGKQGVTLRPQPDEAITVLYDSCAAAVVTPDGSVDLFGEDGFRIGVQAGQWVGSVRAIRTILDHVPPARVVKLPGRQ